MSVNRITPYLYDNIDRERDTCTSTVTYFHQRLEDMRKWLDMAAKDIAGIAPELSPRRQEALADDYKFLIGFTKHLAEAAAKPGVEVGAFGATMPEGYPLDNRLRKQLEIGADKLLIKAIRRRDTLREEVTKHNPLLTSHAFEDKTSLAKQVKAFTTLLRNEYKIVSQERDR